LRAVAAELGHTYLGTRGRALIHGDFYPGSMLNKHGHLYVIDGEFAFRGFPEFDLGVLLAHLMLAKAPAEQLQMLDTNYEKGPDFDAGLVRRFAYVEIIRRLIGIAQLPLSLTLEERKGLLEQARRGLI
ncbi:MAG: phosphotransferase, partial [Bacteroidota bacterium]